MKIESFKLKLKNNVFKNYIYLYKMSSAKNKIALKKLKALDTIWHPESTLVFKSSKEKLVTGRYENDEFIPLDNRALKLCEKWKFKYDESLIKSEGEEEEVEEEVEEEEEEVEEEEVSEEKEEVSEEKEEVTEEKEEVTEEKEEVSEEKEEVSEEKEEKEEVAEEKEEVSEEKEEVSEGEVEEAKNIKKVSFHNTENNNGLSDLTNDYTQKLYNYFDNLMQNYNSQITNLQNELIVERKRYDELTNKYNNEVNDHSETKNSLVKLQAKFDGIKQLFS